MNVAHDQLKVTRSKRAIARTNTYCRYMEVGMGGTNDFAKSQTDSGVIHFLSGMDTED